MQTSLLDEESLFDALNEEDEKSISGGIGEFSPWEVNSKYTELCASAYATHQKFFTQKSPNPKSFVRSRIKLASQARVIATEPDSDEYGIEPSRKPNQLPKATTVVPSRKTIARTTTSGQLTRHQTLQGSLMRTETETPPLVNESKKSDFDVKNYQAQCGEEGHPSEQIHDSIANTTRKFSFALISKQQSSNEEYVGVNFRARKQHRAATMEAASPSLLKSSAPQKDLALEKSPSRPKITEATNASSVMNRTSLPERLHAQTPGTVVTTTLGMKKVVYNDSMMSKTGIRIKKIIPVRPVQEWRVAPDDVGMIEKLNKLLRPGAI